MPLLTTLRSVRVADMALFDWLATGFVAYAIGHVFEISSAAVFILLILSAIILHWQLGVPTRLNAYIGLAKKGDVDAARAYS